MNCYKTVRYRVPTDQIKQFVKYTNFDGKNGR